uniref:Heparan-alpha-glucosaminide N-acetyltransferase catalytic domain-containing protein n=1 Tax=Oryza rufipogon TaxID=4529 RepID=A0A0E0R9G0_ORYRU
MEMTTTTEKCISSSSSVHGGNNRREEYPKEGADDDVEAGVLGRDGEAAATTTRQRLVSLDVFRGITVALMILVDDVGGIVPAISHSPWDGVTLADFVFPFFLFIVGVSLAFAYKKVPDKMLATKKAMLRAVKLFIVGLILQGGFFHGIHELTYGVDIRKIRLMGVLQRIAIAYLVVALCEIWLRRVSSGGNIGSGSMLITRYHHQMFVGLVLVVTYLVILYGLHVPDWEYEVTSPDSTVKHFLVKCGVKGDTGPGCNAVGMIDRSVLGIQHLYAHPVYLKTEQCSMASPRNGPLPPNAPSWCEAPFDPEGLLSSLMAIVTCLIGLQIGHVIVHFKVDVKGYKRPVLPMEWMGKHALMIFVLVACNVIPVLVQGFYWKEPSNNLLKLIGIGG